MNIYSQKGQSQKLGNMSSRQQVLFLLEKTMKEADWDMDPGKSDYPEVKIKNMNDEIEEFRKKQRRQELKEKPERYRQLADSLNMFIPIKRNKFIDRKRWLISEKEAYV